MRRLLALAALWASAGMACWFTDANFNGNYIYAANGTVHYEAEAATRAGAVYRNYSSRSTALPMTVYCKIHSRKTDQSSEESPGYINYVTAAKLQYCVYTYWSSARRWIRQSGWITVKSYNALKPGKSVPVRYWENLKFLLEFDRPGAYFGTNNLDPGGATLSDDVIIIRMYVTDGIYESGDLDDEIEITPDDVTDYACLANDNWSYAGGWTAPFVFKVVYNGKTKIVD